MKNFITLTGRLPMFEGKYHEGDGDKKKSRMNWAMNVQLESKNEDNYYNEALVNFTAWGYFADMLEEINQLDKDDDNRKNVSISVSGKLVAGYVNNDGEIVNNCSINVQELEIIKKNKKSNKSEGDPLGEKSSSKKAGSKPSGKPGTKPGAGKKPPMGGKKPMPKVGRSSGL